MKNEYQNRSGEYEKSYGGSSYNKDERSHYTIRKEEIAPPKARRVKPQPSEDAGGVSEETPDQQMTQKMKRMKTIYKKLFMAWLFLFLLSNVFTCIMNDDSLDEDVQSEETMDDPWGWEDEEMEEDDQTVPDNSEANDSANAAVNDGAYDETATDLDREDEKSLSQINGENAGGSGLRTRISRIARMLMI